MIELINAYDLQNHADRLDKLLKGDCLMTLGVIRAMTK